jgi:hypothetical protein
MDKRGVDFCPARHPQNSLGPMHTTRELSLSGVCPRYTAPTCESGSRWNVYRVTATVVPPHNLSS